MKSLSGFINDLPWEKVYNELRKRIYSMERTLEGVEKMGRADIEKDIIELLAWIAQFGKDENGGVTRLLYQPVWLEAQRALKERMEAEGFCTQYDAVGNLFARLGGSTYKDETIMVGSHIDTVKNGGMYDGQYGIVAGFLAMKYLKEKYGAPLRNIEVVSICEEEGSRFPFVFWGVKNLLGTVTKEDVKDVVDREGTSFVDAMHQAGFDFRDESQPPRQDIKAFLEIHIEQGAVLEIERKSIGIVHSIVGQRRFTVEVTGETNHAGTTPMGYRKDAVYAASNIIAEVIDRAKAYGDPLVATVGRMEVQPNVVNVVPGKVVFTIDTRHTDKTVLRKFTGVIEEIIEEVSSTLGMEIKVDMWMDAEPVPMDKSLVSFVQKQCEALGQNYKIMHSGAGHDAQMMAQHVPTVLLFVPSHKGISHSPFEHTEPKDLAEGLNTLIEALYELAYKEVTVLSENHGEASCGMLEGEESLVG